MTILLDEATRRPLIQILVDTALYAFNEGVHSQDNPDLEDELARVNRARERAHRLMSGKIQRQKADLRRLHEENKRLKDAVAQARVEARERCIAIVAKNLGKFASNSAANALIVELEGI